MTAHGSGERTPAAARRSWWPLVLVIFVVQLGFIFWLGRTDPVLHSPPPPPAPELHWAGPELAEVMSLTDPTLFALPHTQGFSGRAWMSLPQPEMPSRDWVAPAFSLTLRADELGTSFGRRGNGATFRPALAFATPSRLSGGTSTEPIIPLGGVSTLRLEGGLAARELAVPVDLPVWSRTEMLTNSVVQLVVNAAGRPLSAALLGTCGYEAADQFALELARNVRFKPGPDYNPSAGNNSPRDLAWGRFVIEWGTVAVPATNAPVKGP